jgi:hypothetical protein
LTGNLLMNKITTDQALEALESLHDFSNMPASVNPIGAYETLKSFVQQSISRKLEGGNFSHEEVYKYTGTLPPERIEQMMDELEEAQNQIGELENEIDGMVEQDDYDTMEKQLTREVDVLQGELRSLELAISGWLSCGFDPEEAKELLATG